MIAATVSVRQTSWPPTLPPSPSSWVAVGNSFVSDHDIPWTDLNAAGQALEASWRRLLVGDQGSDNVGWDPEAWAWPAPG